jgi:hypothetical protein
VAKSVSVTGSGTVVPLPEVPADAGSAKANAAAVSVTVSTRNLFMGYLLISGRTRHQSQISRHIIHVGLVVVNAAFQMPSIKFQFDTSVTFGELGRRISA